MSTWSKVVVGLTLLYLAWFALPGMWPDVQWVWAGVRTLSLRTLAIGVMQLLLSAVSILLWLASVWLAAKGFQLTRKRAYAFLLAYLLLCTVTEPVSYTVKKLSEAHKRRQVLMLSEAEWSQFQKTQPQEPTVVAVATRTMSLPVGPFLLLVALWYLLQSEQTGKGTLGTVPPDKQIE